jgi:hypothetical protein
VAATLSKDTVRFLTINAEIQPEYKYIWDLFGMRMLLCVVQGGRIDDQRASLPGGGGAWPDHRPNTNNNNNNHLQQQNGDPNSQM